MNILILVSSLDLGGAQKQAVLDANMLAGTDNRIFLGMFELGESGESLKKQVNSEVQTVFFKKKGYLYTAASIAKFVKEKSVEMVHCHLYAPMVIAALASLRVRVPVMWHFHGHHFEVQKFPLNVLSQLPTVKKIIFVSAMLAKYFEKHYWFPKGKIEVVYNSTQSKRYPNQQKSNSVVKIGWVGRLVKLKRVQFLINLASYFKEKDFTSFEILLAGDGPEREMLEGLAKEKGVADKVKFLGFRTDLESIYNQLDLFILPSNEEALSLALIDASNCGLSCIAFDVGGNKEIVKNNETGYIVYSEEEMQRKAYTLCQNAALRNELGTKAEQYAKIFSEEKHLRNLLKIYAQYA